MSTSKLQRYTSSLLSTHLGQHTIRENTRPDWLVTPDGARLELDFYIEELETAIEVQGIQHYVYTPHFHKDYNDFRQRIERDEFKRARCAEMGITLLETDCDEETKRIVLVLAGIKEQPASEPAWVEQAKIYALASVKDRSLYKEYRAMRKQHRKFAKRQIRRRERGAKSYDKKALKRSARELGEMKAAVRQLLAEEVKAYRDLIGI